MALYEKTFLHWSDVLPTNQNRPLQDHSWVTQLIQSVLLRSRISFCLSQHILQNYVSLATLACFYYFSFACIDIWNVHTAYFYYFQRNVWYIFQIYLNISIYDVISTNHVMNWTLNKNISLVKLYKFIDSSSTAHHYIPIDRAL